MVTHGNDAAILAEANENIAEFDIRTPSASVSAGTLSGGNQQKLVVAREFGRDLKLLVLDQPTRGLDVGSVEFIHRQIIAKRNQGTAVLLVSAELDEILEMSDRIAVMYRGELVADVVPPYFVMPVLRGHPLDEHLRHTGGGVHFEAAREILIQLLRALSVAHQAGVVHRDVKPHNIFLERPCGGGRRVLKLLDFGVAWDDQRSVVLTRTGVAVGTPAYMAPEVRVSDPGCQRPCGREPIDFEF